MKQLQTEDAFWNGFWEIAILEPFSFLTDIRYITFLILFQTNTIFPCKGESKASLYNFTPQRYIWVCFFVFFFSQMSSFDRKGRREEGKTREICTSQLDQDELMASNELGQLIGKQIFASTTSAEGFPFLVGKTKHCHEGLSTGIRCPKIQQSLSVCQGHLALVLL